MQIPDVLTCAMAVLSASAATWAACRLLYGRQLKAALRRIDKLNQARLLYDRHGAQVRRQLDHLKRELDLERSRQPWAPSPTPPPRVVVAAGAGWQDTDVGDAAVALSGDGFAPTVATDGFAATRPMPRSGHAGNGRGAAASDGFAATVATDGFAATRPMPRHSPPAFGARDLGRRGQVG